MKNETSVKEMVPDDRFLLDFNEKIDHSNPRYLNPLNGLSAFAKLFFGQKTQK